MLQRFPVFLRNGKDGSCRLWRNSLLVSNLSVDKIISILENWITRKIIRKCWKWRGSEKTNMYLYSNIAQKSLECC